MYAWFHVKCALYLNMSRKIKVIFCQNYLTQKIWEIIALANFCSMNLFECPKSKIWPLSQTFRTSYGTAINRSLPFMKANDGSPLCALPHPGKSLSLVTKAKSAKTVGLSSLTSGKVWPRWITWNIITYQASRHIFLWKKEWHKKIRAKYISCTDYRGQ